METSIQKCQAFLETVRCGSFTRAAEALRYSQSGVSRMVADLERDWGVVLLERGRAGVRLTEEGKSLLPFAEALCESSRRLQMQVDGLNGLDVGSIRIGTFSSVATHWLPRVIERFQRDYPNIEYELLMGDYAEIQQWLAEGRVDLGFLPFVPSLELFVAYKLEEDELLAVLPEGHELACAEGVPVEQLCEGPFIMLEKSGDDEVSSIFASRSLEPRVRFTTFDDYAIMSMVESGLGVSILPALILRRSPYRLAVRQLEPRVFRSIYAVLRKKERLPLAAERFVTYLDYRNG
ncbi:LysR family transcriptional regulator [Olsenella urininfantis]|uniref:LysR family transcriptional regulator n=1 Tax=Olsenella urininfantis TaxID=1871033 RepID=UPI000987430C|nr:LysR family transcriptional regulator [Olsenella urininfantis]